MPWRVAHMLRLGLVRQLHGGARALVGLLQDAVAYHSTSAAAVECGGNSGSNDCGSPSSGPGSSNEHGSSSSSNRSSPKSSSSSPRSRSPSSSSSSSPTSSSSSSSGPRSSSSSGPRSNINWRPSSSSPSRGQAVQPSNFSNKQRWRPDMDQQQHNVPVSKQQGQAGNRSNSQDKERSKQRTRLIQAQQTPEQLLALLQQHSADFDRFNISAAFVQAKKVCRTGVLPGQQPAAVQHLLQHLHQLAQQLQQQCGARELANIMSACGHLRLKCAVELVLPEFLQPNKLRQADPQNVSNTLWAVATLDMQPATTVVQQLVQQFIKVLPQAKPQEVADTLGAAATLCVQLAEDDVQQLVQHLEKVLAQANPQDISNTLGACSTMGVQLTARVVQQLVQHLIKALPQANSQDVANTLGAAARLDHTLSAHQLEQLLRHFQSQLHCCIPQEVAETLVACGCMQYAPLQLLSALEQQPHLLNALLATADPQALANMAWACGQLGHKSKLLPGVVLQQAVQRLRDSTGSSFTMQNLCNLCWSAAVLDLTQCVPQVLQLVSACLELWATAVDVEHRQLHQVHLWLLDCQLPAPGQGSSGVLSQQQLQQCKYSWERQLQRETASDRTSDLQRSVFDALQALPRDTWQHCDPPKLEQRTKNGALSIDISATTRSGVRLAIEVDGPSHFVQPLPGADCTLTGPTIYRNRALAAQGYVVVSIPYREWDKRRGAAQKQQQYLLSKLQAAEQAAMQAAEQTPKQAAKQAAEQVAEQVAEQATEQATEQTTEQTTSPGSGRRRRRRSLSSSSSKC